MIKTLKDYLADDPDSYRAFKSCMAMSFKDEYSRCKKRYKNKEDIHKIANDAANYFIDLLIKD